MTIIGIALLFGTMSLVLPVTSHAILHRRFASALGQLSAVAEGTLREVVPADGDSSSSGSRAGREQPCTPAAAAEAAPQEASTPSGSSPGSSSPAAGELQLPTAFLAAAVQRKSSPELQGISPAASQPTTPPPTPPPPSRMRRQRLVQQPSLIAIPPDPAALAGSSRQSVVRAARQLRQPAGSELVAGSEQLLGPVYSRLVMRAWQVGVPLWCLCA